MRRPLFRQRSHRRGRPGTTVKIEEETKYPFEDKIHFTVHTDRAAAFPLCFRIPSWCKAASASVNGKRVNQISSPGKFLRIDRDWKNNDRVTLNLPMKITVRRWSANHDSASVNYGPLTFSLKIGETYVQRDSSKTAIGDSGWQKTADPSKWPSFEIHPATPWNYGLVLNASDPARSFKFKRPPWPQNNFPFTLENCPIQLEAQARRIPQWTLDSSGLCGTLPQSPVITDQPIETVTLVPMGAARLRISAFPVVENSH